ncbi:transposase [Klebsiella pneumoniae IS43]|uniref:Transposase n=1 Tax=Klebsiella pneumoniae IS43 TaxID=1432552 RepID=W1DU73_KLEPN|nr:transposase [Klebsiella pneumoniae IS43]
MMNFHLNAVTNLVLRLGPVAQRWELSLARAVFLHRLGEIRDRKPENQSYRASGLTLLTATISLWNTVYMERAVDALKRKGVKINEQLLSHFVAVRLGAYQSDRRLHLEKQQNTGLR